MCLLREFESKSGKLDSLFRLDAAFFRFVPSYQDTEDKMSANKEKSWDL